MSVVPPIYSNFSVIPAKAGIHGLTVSPWTPAFARVTQIFKERFS
jgi:hypothetical protein